MQRDVGLDPLDHHHVEAAPHARDRLRRGRGRRSSAWRSCCRSRARSRSPRGRRCRPAPRARRAGRSAGSCPGEGTKVTGSSALIRHSRAWPENTMSFCEKESGCPGRDVDLLLHEVAPGDELGDAVLDLDARVHLHEVVVAVLVEQELDRARAHVLHRGAPPRRRSSHAPAELLASRRAEGASSMSFWWRRWIEHSRSPRCTTLPLLSAITWISMWRGLVDVLLDVDVGHAEGGLGLGLGGAVVRGEVRRPRARCACRARRRPRRP